MPLLIALCNCVGTNDFVVGYAIMHYDHMGDYTAWVIVTFDHLKCVIVSMYRSHLACHISHAKYDANWIYESLEQHSLLLLLLHSIVVRNVR